MAIYPKLTAFAQGNAPSSPPPQLIDMGAWTAQATQSLATVSLSPPSGVRGTSVTLAIDVEGNPPPQGNGDVPPVYRPRREPMRRDSLKRREALLKGKEGSRRRTRWENDRLLNNPWAQPPLPSDWEVHPTYPKHVVPYYLAPLWDHDMAARAGVERKERATTRQRTHTSDESAGKVPRDLREKLKKSNAAKALLKDLEEQVRLFVKNWEDKANREAAEKAELHSEDDEIVFVGRNGQMSNTPRSPHATNSMDESELQRDRLVFDSLANDQGANFGRWLVHSIASYYGLRTWSVTVGDPARREAYVGIPPTSANGGLVSPVLPRPLWGRV